MDPGIIAEKETETADLNSDEHAAQLASLQDADLVVRGTLTVEVIDRTEEKDEEKVDLPVLPVISAITTGVFRVIRPETSEIVFSFDHEDLPPGRKDEIRGFGTTDDKAIVNSIDGFIPVSAEKLAWELASKLEEPI